MCDGNSEWCEMFVKWYSGKKQYRMYCRAHGFKDQEYVTKEEFEYIEKHHPEMISQDRGPILW